ncbi:MAG: DEAD/DEAH box helicase [Chloroflexi bacterium]|nr:DEAD/DEAH box helicase [Chloroflexota bacterium]
MISSPQRDAAPHAFGVLPVSAPIARSLAAMRYHQPTPIQERTIPVLRRGRDVLAQAQTGTGKTAGFGIPLIEAIRTQERVVQAIVLVPTRELCLQVADELRRLGAHAGVTVTAVYGGVGLGRQIEELQRGAHVMVGTPGRVEDLMQRGALKLGRVRFAVLDEADRMLDVGFLPAIERILKQTPSGRQTSLFSATIPVEVRGLAHRHMRDPVTVEVDPERPTVEEIDQRFERVPDGDKLAALRAYLDDPACYLALVFRRTTYKADRLARDLSRRGYKVAVLHGRRSQSQRERVLADLKSGKLQALVATDIAARGLDIAGLTHVFNYDLPDTPETYVHRIGRTGRAGESGTAVTLIGPEDEEALRTLQRYLAGRRDAASATARPAARPATNGGRSTESVQHTSRAGDGGRPPRPEGGNAAPRQGAPTPSTRRNRGRWRGAPRQNG